MKLSILMPVFNEEARLPEALKQAFSVDYPCAVELVVVDDGSRDATPRILAQADDARVNVVTHPRNQGKGAAIRSAVARATGDYMVILDADLEYDPQDIPRLLDPVPNGHTDVVYGSRNFGSHSSFFYWSTGLGWKLKLPASCCAATCARTRCRSATVRGPARRA